jgi:hypothetical protein
MYDILIMRNGVVPMTGRFALLKSSPSPLPLGTCSIFLRIAAHSHCGRDDRPSSESALPGRGLSFKVVMDRRLGCWLREFESSVPSPALFAERLGDGRMESTYD